MPATEVIGAGVGVGAADDRRDEPVEEAGFLHDRGEAQRAEDEPDGGQHARHAAAGEQVVDRGVAARRHEPVGHRLVDGLDAVEDDALAGFVDERLDGGALGEAGEDPGEHGDAEDAEERRDLAQREHDQQRQRQQVERRDVERRRQDVAGLVDADGRRGGIVDDADDEVDEERR